MNTQITITQAVWPFDGRTLVLALTAEGVLYDSTTIPWDKVDDMEFLSQEFREIKVYEFQALCTALGKAYLMKGVITSD